MKILLTGFEPFGAVRVNPSAKIVEELAARASSAQRVNLVTKILPTEFAAAGNQIRRLIRTIRPSAVVCLGVAAARKSICLERVALNLDDEPLPDNAGAVRQDRRIVRSGPVAYWSTLPLQEMCKALKERGISAVISNHAGAYVCNHVFYSARHEMERTGSRAPCGLIHVPALKTKGRVSGTAGMPLAKMVAAVECCLEVLRTRGA